jgi:hypothetical protein
MAATLVPLGRISMDGRLTGTLKAVDEAGAYLGYLADGNWSSPPFQEREVKRLASAIGVSQDLARAMISQAMARLLGDADAAPLETEPPTLSARFPSLIDLVAGDDGEPLYLLHAAGGGVGVAAIASTPKGRLAPPGAEHLPYLLPRASAVLAAFASDTDFALYHDLMDFFRRAGHLPPELYPLLALFALHTHLADGQPFSPWLTFSSRDSERGKSRLGNAVAGTSYRGFTTETLQEANLFRWSDSLGATIFFDVRDLITKAEKRGADDILLNRYSRDTAKVGRVLDPQAGPFHDTRYFDVYGPTIIAVNAPLRDPYLSRALEIVPPEAARRWPTLTREDALPYRERGVAFRARYLGRPLPEVEKPADGRIGDIMQPLAQVAALVGPEAERACAALVTYFGESRRQARAEAPEADLVRAFLTLTKGSAPEQGECSLEVAKVTIAVNAERPEKAQLSPEQVGRRLSALGFKADKVAGQRVRRMDADDLAALARKFGLEEGKK